MFWPTEADWLGKRVVNGSGMPLGCVVDIVAEPDGGLREIVVRQDDGAKDWIVEADNIKSVGEEVYLKGPREGFHIAPLPSVRGVEAMAH